MFDKKLYHNHIYSLSQVPYPQVSICIISFNHEKYLAKCLESVFNQKVNFNFEVIIGDDCSNDNSQSIIKSFIEKYPNKITSYFHPFNLGPSNCRGKYNFTNAFLSCRGKYIVYIEGDDYFIDEEKLQIQYNFLEKNKSFSACFHNAKIIWEDWNDRPDEYVNKSNQKDIILTPDLLTEKEKWFMATASVMIRKSMILPLPKWFLKSVSGDIPMYILLAEKGPIKYIDRCMSVYRKNLGGQSFVYKLQQTSFVKNRIELYKNLNAETNRKYNYLIRPILSDYYNLLALTDENKKNSVIRLLITLKSFWYLPHKSMVKLHNAIIKNVTFSKRNGPWNLAKLLFKDFLLNIKIK